MTATWPLFTLSLYILSVWAAAASLSSSSRSLSFPFWVCVCVFVWNERETRFFFFQRHFSCFRKFSVFLCGGPAKTKNRFFNERKTEKDPADIFAWHTQTYLLLKCYREYRDERYLPLSRARACARLDAIVVLVLVLVIVQVVFSAVWRKRKKMKCWNEYDCDDREGWRTTITTTTTNVSSPRLPRTTATVWMISWTVLRKKARTESQTRLNRSVEPGKRKSWE